MTHEEQRMRTWREAFCATANAEDCKHAKVAVGWADTALEEFDKRFPAPKAKPEPKKYIDSE